MPRAIQKQKGTEDSGPRRAAPASPADTTPKVTGIGGIFFFLDDPKGTNEYFAPSRKDFMVACRVQNIEGLVAMPRSA